MKLRSILLFAAPLSVLLSACSAAEDGANYEGTENVSTSVDGLSVVEADEASGKLIVKFERDGRVITYDMRLGPKMTTPPSSEELAADPELPSYEVDARVTDANGDVFNLQMGGDSFIDGSWDQPTVENIDEAGRAQDFLLLSEAVSAFRKLRVPAGVEQLRLTGIRIGQGAALLGEKPGEELGQGRPGLGLKAIQVTGPSSVAKWDFQVRRKPAITILGIGIADHSAVLLRGWSSSNGIVYSAVSCNHGACANDSSMSTHCTMPGWRTDNGTHRRYFYSDGCTTPYAWNSAPGHHNCNDDSELQGRAIWTNQAQSTTGGSCGAAGAHYFAPGCSF